MPKKRGNGAGSIVKTKSGQFRAMIVTEIYTVIDADGTEHQRRKTMSRVCKTKRAAEDALYALREELERRKKTGTAPAPLPTLQQAIDKWEAWYRRPVDDDSISNSTMTCYLSALAHVTATLGNKNLGEITIDELQETLDAIPHGKRTKQNAKCALGLVYDYWKPRDQTKRLTFNPREWLKISYNKATENYTRDSLTDEELARLLALADTGDSDAQAICVLVYMGWRIGELLSLEIDHVDTDRRMITGGSKTEKGRNRGVPVHSRVWPYVERAIGGRDSGLIWGDPKKHYQPYGAKHWTEKHFYPAIERAQIDNPLVPSGGGTTRHRITPHSCRHTTTRLMKNALGIPDKTKMDVMGHADPKTFRNYMDSTPDERRAAIEAMAVPGTKNNDAAQPSERGGDATQLIMSISITPPDLSKFQIIKQED